MVDHVSSRLPQGLPEHAAGVVEPLIGRLGAQAGAGNEDADGEADLPVHIGCTFSARRFVQNEFVSGGQ